MVEEIKDECAGKKLLEKNLELIRDQNTADSEISGKRAQEWANNLKKDFCCISYKYYVQKWSWKKLSHYFTMSDVEAKPEISIYNGDKAYRCVNINLPGIPYRFWNRYVTESRTELNWGCDWDEGGHVNYKLIFHPSKVMNERRFDDLKQVSYESFLEQVCKELAEYTANMEYGYNPRT